jgi:flagellar L-ring protein precursor FlgH
MSISSVLSFSRVLLAAGLALMLAGCGAGDRLKNVGQAPPLSAIEDPTQTPGYRPVSMPMPTVEPAVYEANSLWRSGSRAFFRDQRARQVGDILTVTVDISDRAEIENATNRKRSGSEDFGAEGAVGTKLLKVLPGGTEAGAIVDLSAGGSSSGSGSVDRQERLTTTIAAVVTQILPNGNLVIEGRQEIRVNFEMRELVLAGIVRPEDIDSNNTVESSKIAQARISYGGRGQITDVQQPRYGQQVMDILLPF